MKTHIQFSCQGQTLLGKFYTASGSAAPLTTLLLLPGFPGNEDDVLDLGAALSLHGLNAMTFNYRGTYQSEGKFSLNNSVTDVQAAFAFLQDIETAAKFQVDSNRLVLGGWSYGGGLGLIYAANHHEVSHVFSLSGNDFGAIGREYQRNEAFAAMVDEDFASLEYPNGPVRFAGFTGRTAVKNDLLLNLAHFDLLPQSAKLVDRNILLMGGWDDNETVLENEILPFYRRLKELGAENVQIKAFQDGHRFENRRSAIVETILGWLDANG